MLLSYSHAYYVLSMAALTPAVAELVTMTKTVCPIKPRISINTNAVPLLRSFQILLLLKWVSFHTLPLKSAICTEMAVILPWSTMGEAKSSSSDSTTPVLHQTILCVYQYCGFALGSLFPEMETLSWSLTAGILEGSQYTLPDQALHSKEALSAFLSCLLPTSQLPLPQKSLGY